MSKQDLKHIAIVLQHFEAMGANEAELESEKEAMMAQPMIISANLQEIGLV